MQKFKIWPKKLLERMRRSNKNKMQMEMRKTKNLHHFTLRLKLKDQKMLSKTKE